MTLKLKKSEKEKKARAVEKLKLADRNSEETKDLIVKCLEDGKAEELEVISLKGKSTIADYIVVASGTSSRHIYSLADNLSRKIKEELRLNPVVDGRSGTDWVVMDVYDVIVHIFHPESRELYNIEEIWQ